MDKLSYALGLSMGQNFIGSGVKDINVDDFADALRAVYTDGEKKMTYDEAKQVVTEYFTELEKRLPRTMPKQARNFWQPTPSKMACT